MQGIEAEVIRVATTTDGAIRVTLDLPSFNKNIARIFMDKAVDNETVKFVLLDNAVCLEQGDN